MKRIVSMVLAMIMLAGLLPPKALVIRAEEITDVSDTDIDLFVFAGQSNMMGAAVLEPEVDTFTDKALEYKYMPRLRGADTGAFVSAQNPAGEWHYQDLNAAYGDYLNDLSYKSTLSNYSANTYFCPAMSNGTEGFSAQSEADTYPSASLPPYFVTEYESYGHSSIYAHMAKGAVNIVHYFTEEMMTRYNSLISEYNSQNSKAYSVLTSAGLSGAGDAFDDKFNAMLQDYAAFAPDNTLENKCFVWLQGEGDSGNSYIEYKFKLQVLWEHLQELGFTHFFVLRVGYWGSTGILNVIKAQEDFCAENENCHIVTRAPSLIPHPGATTDNWWISEPSAEYDGCRDSYLVDSGNHHFNEKAMQIFAERAALNVHRILHLGQDPILEEENIQGMPTEEDPDTDILENTTPYTSYIGTEAFCNSLSVSKKSDQTWAEQTYASAASTDLIPVSSADSVWLQYVFFKSEAHAVGGFYDADGNLVAPLYFKDFGFAPDANTGGVTAFQTPEASNRVSIAAIEAATGKQIAFVRFTAWQASAGGHANTEARIYHTYTEAVTAPTCTEQGYTTYTCACGESYVADFVDAAGHSFVNAVCTKCGADAVIWEQGTIGAANGLEKDYPNVIRTEDYLRLSDYVGMTLNADYYITYFVYDAQYNYLGNGKADLTANFLLSGQGISTHEMRIRYPEGEYFRIALWRGKNGEMTPDMLEGAGVKFLDSSQDPVFWEMGSIYAASGIAFVREQVIRSVNYLPVEDYAGVTVAEGYAVSFLAYDENLNYLGNGNPEKKGYFIPGRVTMQEILDQYPATKYVRLLLVEDPIADITMETVKLSEIRLYKAGETVPEKTYPYQGLEASFELAFTHGLLDVHNGTYHCTESGFVTTVTLPLEHISKITWAEDYAVLWGAYNARKEYLGSCAAYLTSGEVTKADILAAYGEASYIALSVKPASQRELELAEMVKEAGLVIHHDLSHTGSIAHDTVMQAQKSQDGAIFNDTLFLFDKYGVCTVYGMDSKRKLGSFTLDKVDVLSPHANSVCFSDVYYAQGDPFPLLYVNIYNNYWTTDDPKEGTCCVYRILEENGTYSAKLVQVLKIGFTDDYELWNSAEGNGYYYYLPYGNFIVDTDEDKLWAFVLRNSDDQTRFFKFDLPDMSEGVYNETYGCNLVTLEASDIEDMFDLEHFEILQGCTYADGKIYSANGLGTSSKYNAFAELKVVDLRSKSVAAVVDFSTLGFSLEPEMISFHVGGDGQLYYLSIDGVLRRLRFVDDPLNTLPVNGSNDHTYENGICTGCGGVDPAWERITLGDFAVAGVGTGALSSSTVRLSQKTLIAVPYPGAALTVIVGDGYQACVYSGNNSNRINQNSGWLGADGDNSFAYTYTLPEGSIYMRLSIRKTDGGAITQEDLALSGLTVLYESTSDIVKDNSDVADILENTALPVLIHLSDIHGDVIRAERAAWFAQQVGADALLASGDLTAYDPDDWGSALFDAVGKYADVNFVYGIGNHDAKISPSVYQEIIYNSYFKENPSTPNGETYYYRDLADQKLRLISVNQQEGASTTTRGGTCYSQAQVEWLVETLKSTPAGYGVVLMYHSPETTIAGAKDPGYSEFFQTGNRYDTPTNSTSGYSGTILMDLVDAFMMRKSFTWNYSEKNGASPVTLNADFSDVAEGVEFIAHVTGHVHSDSITYLPGTACKQLLLGVTCTTSMYGADGGYYGLADYSDLNRQADNANQDAFNAYIIDRENKTVRVLRVGARQTVSGDTRDDMTIPYSIPFEEGEYPFDTEGLVKLDLSNVEWVNYGIQAYGVEPTYKPGVRYSTNAIFDVPYEGVTFYIKINAPYEMGIRSGTTDTTMTTNYYWLNNKALASGDQNRGYVYTIPAGHEKFILSIANVSRDGSNNVTTTNNPLNWLDLQAAGVEIWYSPEQTEEPHYPFDTADKVKLDLSNVEWVNYGIQAYGTEPSYLPGLRISADMIFDVPYEGVTFYVKINAPYELGIRSGETDTTMTTNHYWLNNKYLVSGNNDRGYIYTIPAGHRKFILSVANITRNDSGNYSSSNNPITLEELEAVGLEIWYVLGAEEWLPGDINGDGEVNNKDVTRLFRHLSGYDVEVVEAALDVNGDGEVNNKDLTRLFRYLSGYDVEIQ